jgi:hypothetical protein
MNILLFGLLVYQILENYGKEKKEIGEDKLKKIHILLKLITILMFQNLMEKKFLFKVRLMYLETEIIF